MTAYLVAEIKWHDLEKRKEYYSRFKPILDKYKGRSFMVGGNEPQLLEGSWKPHRVVIVEFPTMMRLRRWYYSKEYAPLLRIRKQGAKTNIVVVEGPRVYRSSKRGKPRKPHRSR